MNKGIIMEVRHKYAIALNDEGIMEKIISKQNMSVGQKIFYFQDDIINVTTNKAHRYNNFMKSFVSIAALFLLVFTFFNTMKYDQAYAVVSVDINPSIQIEANSNQQIIKVEGVNTDGKNIDFSDIKNMSLDDGMQKIKEKLIEKNYLDTNKEVLVGYAFTKSGDNSAYEDNIIDAIKSTFKTENITYLPGDKEDIDEAKTKGISLGRYEASLVVDEETKNKIDKAPVKDITAILKDKDNEIKWEAEDEKLESEKTGTNDAQVTNTDKNTDVKSGTPVAEKPAGNDQTDNSQSNNNTDIPKEKDNKTKSEDKDVLDLKPEVPTQSEQNKDSTSSKDSSINIVPNNGTIENKTTSGKIPEDPNKISNESAKTDGTLVNKETNK